ncbi:hypothetical protein [Brachybacterium huguangmaarense]
MKIIAPTPFTGTRSGARSGAKFRAGVAYTDYPAAVAYFTRNGYTVTDESSPYGPADPRGVNARQVGTPTRDAAQHDPAAPSDTPEDGAQ